MTTPEPLRVAVDDGVATLIIDRRAQANALDHATVVALRDAVAELTARADVGALIVTGAGDSAFVAGADINELRQWRRVDALRAQHSELFAMIERCPKPTIAAVNGAAVGGGCELALACDLRIAAAHARFALPEVGLGVVPAAGATQRLPRIVGLGRAKHMVLTGEAIAANVALEWGLVSAVVPARELMPTAARLAKRISARSPLAVRLAKLLLDSSSSTSLDPGLMMETLAQAICFEAPDKDEGTRAFFEKREPRFPAGS